VEKPIVTRNVLVLVECAVHSYQDLLSVKTIDVFQFGSRPVYARLRSRIGTTIIMWLARAVIP
jgi:hypothetical protein